jgi:hypothetical protein
LAERLEVARIADRHVQERQPGCPTPPKPEDQRREQDRLDGGAPPIEHRHIVFGVVRRMNVPGDRAVEQQEIDQHDCPRDVEAEGGRGQAGAEPPQRHDPHPMYKGNAGGEDHGQPQRQRQGGRRIQRPE